MSPGVTALSFRHARTSPAMVKTIARGMPGVSGVTVVTTLVCFFILHARLRAHRAPGIPCALFQFEGETFDVITRAPAARSRRCVFNQARHSGGARQREPGISRFPDAQLRI